MCTCVRVGDGMPGAESHAAFAGCGTVVYIGPVPACYRHTCLAKEMAVEDMRSREEGLRILLISTCLCSVPSESRDIMNFSELRGKAVNASSSVRFQLMVPSAWQPITSSGHAMSWNLTCEATQMMSSTVRMEAEG